MPARQPSPAFRVVIWVDQGEFIRYRAFHYDQDNKHIKTLVWVRQIESRADKPCREPHNLERSGMAAKRSRARLERGRR